MKTKLPIALSNKHCHLTREDIDALFGKDYQLTLKKKISQPGQFASEEKVEIVGEKGSMIFRVLGPARSVTQIEILAGDAFKLGVPIVYKDSGDIEGTPGCTIIGPKGKIVKDKGVMVAARHIHMNPQQAKEYDVKDGDYVKVKVGGPRGLVFDNVLIRSNDKCELEMHVDTEEGNACGAKNGDLIEIIKE